MDGARFDTWTRRLAGRRSRRTVAAAALGGILGAVGLAGPDRAGADTLCKPEGKKCNKDAQCCAGLACLDGSCAPAPCAGNTPCTTNADCCSGLCLGEQLCCPKCPSGCTCTAGTDLGLICVTGGSGGICDVSTDCPPGEACERGNCVTICTPQ